MQDHVDISTFTFSPSHFQRLHSRIMLFLKSTALASDVRPRLWPCQLPLNVALTLTLLSAALALNLVALLISPSFNTENQIREI